MKYVSILILLSSLGLLIQGCGTTPDASEDSLVVIDKSELAEVESWQFSDIYKDVGVVPLETSECSLFADIRQTVCTDSMIFVRASFSSYSDDAGVWQFSRSGQFVRQLGSVGEGPGEYHSIKCIVLKDDTLFAFDGYNRNVLCYNAISGEYLKSSMIDEYEPLRSVNTVLPIPGSDNFLISSDVIFGDNTYGIAEGNPLTNYFKCIVPQKFKVSDWISYGLGSPTMSKLNEKEALAFLPLNDTIYSVEYSTLQVKPFALLNLGFQIPKFADGEEFETALNQVNEQGFYNGISSIYASGDYLILNQKLGSIIWNHTERKGWYTMNGWNPSKASGLPFMPMQIVEAQGDNTFVCAYSAAEFIEYSQTQFDKSIVKMPAGVENLDDESNDILVIYRLK